MKTPNTEAQRTSAGSCLSLDVVQRPNIVLITLDQFRGDCLSAAGHPLVQTPNLDALTAEGVRLARHYSQAAPCGPGRAALYTGTYQFNNRVVANGTPLDARFDNVALAARRGGYIPTLFGYTDQSIDPRLVTDRTDERLYTYEGVDVGLDLRHNHEPWLNWLRSLGHEVDPNAYITLRTEPTRAAEHSVSAFVTNEAMSWIARQDQPWFAHLSYLRPHPPYAAAGTWSTFYDPDDVGEPIAASPMGHPFHDAVRGHREFAAPADEAKWRKLRAQYFGMVSEVDSQLGRLWQMLRDSGQWDNTFIVVTADHGEQLGDHGLINKVGFFESSYHVVGIVRDPTQPHTHGNTVQHFTENVDILPTLCTAMGVATPAQADGCALQPLLQGDAMGWREAAHWEYDWRDWYINGLLEGDALDQQNLAVLRNNSTAYVQFGDGSWRCFDLAADPTWRTEVTDPAIVLVCAQAMLTWRSRHSDRTLTGLLLSADGPRGRWPQML